ncbi:MAG: histidine phosphatase family protein [Acidimicrobiia bacterium]
MLIIVRHGQTHVNAERRLQGHLDAELDDVGRAQAASLAAAVGSVSRIVCSPLLRARQTAAAIGAPVTVDERWIEIDYGVLDGRSLDEVGATSLWSDWHADLGLAPEGGESITAVIERVKRACADLVAEATDTDVAVVSHVTPIKAAVVWAMGVPDPAIWRMFLATASVTRIGFGPRGPVLRSFNETAHLG